MKKDLPAFKTKLNDFADQGQNSSFIMKNIE
jgi:hypothetical protein